MPNSPALLPVEYLVILVYLIFLAAIGPFMRSFNRNSDDYFRGGARTKWWLIGPSLAISIISAAGFTGSAGAIYESGLAPLAINFGQWFAGILLIAFLAAWFRQLRKVTPAEAVRERFGPATEQFFAYLNMCMGPIYGAFQLLGLSIFVAAVFRIPIETTILVLGVVVGVYSVSGGKWAVMATDFVQNLVLQAVIIAVGILAITKMGGIMGLYDFIANSGNFEFAYAEGTYPDGKYTIGWMIAVFCMQFIAQLQLGWSARFFMAKDGKEARMATALMFAILIGNTLFFIATPLAARMFFADQVQAFGDLINKPAESAYVVSCINLLPAGMMGLVLVAMFSATASSMDSGLNSNAAVIVRNIMPPLRRMVRLPELDGQSELQWGRRVSIILTMVIIGTAFALATFGKGGIFELMLNFASRVQVPLTIPFVLALFLRNAPRCSALYSIGFGLLGPLILLPLLALVEIEPDFPGRLIVVAFCSLTGFSLSYLLGGNEKHEQKALTKQFYHDMHRPVDFEKEVGQANDRAQLQLIGRLSLALGLLILLLLVVPNPLAGRLTILGIGSGIALIGGGMLLAARKEPANKLDAKLPAPVADRS